jgi:hypothetical protein
MQGKEEATLYQGYQGTNREDNRRQQNRGNVG